MLKKLVDLWTIFRANIRLKYAIRKAEKAHQQHRERFYVMPDHNDRLIIMHRDGMRKLRRYGYMDNRVRIKDLIRESFYFTADGAGNSLTAPQMEAKRRMYLEYVVRSINYMP